MVSRTRKVRSVSPVRFELTRPRGAQVLSLPRMPFRHGDMLKPSRSGLFEECPREDSNLQKSGLEPDASASCATWTWCGAWAPRNMGGVPGNRTQSSLWSGCFTDSLASLRSPRASRTVPLPGVEPGASSFGGSRLVHESEVEKWALLARARRFGLPARSRTSSTGFVDRCPILRVKERCRPPEQVGRRRKLVSPAGFEPAYSDRESEGLGHLADGDVKEEKRRAVKENRTPVASLACSHSATELSPQIG